MESVVVVFFHLSLCSDAHRLLFPQHLYGERLYFNCAKVAPREALYPSSFSLCWSGIRARRCQSEIEFLRSWRAEREIKISLEHTPAAFGFAIVKVSPAQS